MASSRFGYPLHLIDAFLKEGNHNHIERYFLFSQPIRLFHAIMGLKLHFLIIRSDYTTYNWVYLHKLGTYCTLLKLSAHIGS